jgi:hypothetical protein
MKKLSLSVCLAFAFFVASAVAQMAPGGSQGTQNSSPNMSQPGQQQQPGTMGQPDNTSPSAQTDQGSAHNNTNGEHKLKGCVQSQGGQYVLETKKGKTVPLAGQDVSAHVGHEVAVKGTWENGMSATSSGNTGSAGSAGSSSKTFNVTDVKMISKSCGGKSHSGNMDHSSQGTGTGTGNSGNSTTQPPQ